MKKYWDSSALIKALHAPEVRLRLSSKVDVTRTHTLSEVFSTLTKGVNFRYSPDGAAKLIESVAGDLDFVDVSKTEALAAIQESGLLGVRGARIHDLIHAIAARKSGATVLMTLDMAGFTGLVRGLKIEAP